MRTGTDRADGSNGSDGSDRAPEDQGEHAVRERIVREQHARVHRVALALTRNLHDAEDLTQDVLVRVFDALHTYTPGNFDGWVTTITYNLWRDRWRRRRRLQVQPLSDAVADSLPAPAADEVWRARSLDLDVRAALTALPGPYRAAVVLCDLEGLSYEDVAAVLGVPVGTVRSRISRGRALLRVSLAHRAPRPTGRGAPAALVA